MKFIVTGSLGHISKPLATSLVEKGHAVTVISSQGAKQKEIEALGAVAAIGSLEDLSFLTQTFTGADAVYSMVPPNNYFDHSLDLIAYYRGLGSNYANAIAQSGVKRLVHLSTIGADLEKGSGILLGAHHVEDILNELSPEIGVTFMRPTSFYYNLYSYVDMIKSAGVIAANYGGDDMVPWVSPFDIAAAVAEELLTPFKGRKIRYVASEEVSCNETAAVLGAAIGKPGLKWNTISNEQMQTALKSAGMNPEIAEGLVEMYEGLHTGNLLADYYHNKPAVMGKTKLKDFAKEFAGVYHKTENS
ncbi:NAD-dependent epimerase/dehydratase family protein [Segetibacter sp. 3557_3]|uniref:NmrA family NAD(P)-binding protein n=1 Tax=Segetibacter sp. 3557_3 TaxID=2547429 RepID=UPI001058E462|nr:NmrA family NAD(P)-binding protein [Segetibacter sp. 3557_3]TDH24552.1 NAD-dependent epimerase/dehydratase family protein [Segetibacter sp. 3557_3]